MDAGTGLAIVSLLLEIGQISAGIYKDFTDQRDQVRRVEDLDSEKDLQRLKSYSLRLRSTSLSTIGPSAARITEHQQSLKELADRSIEITDQIVSIWKVLQPSGKQSTGESLMKAWKSMMKKTELKRLEDQLDSCRHSIEFQVLLCINEKNDLLMDLSTKIHNSQQQLGDSILQVRDDITTVLTVNDRRFQGTIMGLRDGRALTASNTPFLELCSGDETKPISTMASIQAYPRNDEDSAMARDFQHLFDLVKHCLHFDGKFERKNAIRAAHLATFDWIFTKDGSDSETEAFSSFPLWLESGHGCYWIAGKAGSGKSTLMKKIIESPKTQEHLRVWSGERELHSASFFFWHLGMTMQKSSEGMLRSLLSTLLEHIPQVILSAMSELLIEASRLPFGASLDAPSLEQLQRWFRAFAKLCQASGSIKICFFVDGLDEYSGNKLDLADLILDLSSQCNEVKFVVASRPLPAFNQAFGGFPGLRVQDLTSTDIKVYTRGLLAKGSTIVSDDEVNELTSVISDRSRGVFLWVVVVVKSVLDGLCEGDTVMDLQERVRKFPPELKDLYQRMLEGIGDDYQSEAAEMLLLVAMAFGSTHVGHSEGAIHPFPAIQLYFAVQGCTKALDAPIKTYTDEEVQHKINWLVLRLSSRCLGLVELRNRSKEIADRIGSRAVSAGKKSLAMIIEPFHRTAIEFLEDEGVYQLLVSLARPAFDPFQSLFCSIIWMAKIAPGYFPQVECGSTTDLPPWYHFWEVLFLSIDAGQRGIAIKDDYLSELDRVLSLHWEKWGAVYAPKHYKDHGWLSIIISNRDTTQGNWIVKDGSEDEFYNLGLDDKLFAEVLARYKVIGLACILSLMALPDQISTLLRLSPLSRDDATLLLRILLQSEPGAKNMVFPEVAVALNALLDAGADPNAPDWRKPKRSLWTGFLVDLHGFLSSRRSAAHGQQGSEALVSMVQTFLDHGADLAALVPFSDRLFRPSIYMQYLHALVDEHLSRPKQENTVDAKLKHVVEGLAAAAELLERREIEAGVHRKRSRVSQWMQRLPLGRTGKSRTGS